MAGSRSVKKSLWCKKFPETARSVPSSKTQTTSSPWGAAQSCSDRSDGDAPNEAELGSDQHVPFYPVDPLKSGLTVFGTIKLQLCPAALLWKAPLVFGCNGNFAV